MLRLLNGRSIQLVIGMSYVLDIVKSIAFTVIIEHKKAYIHCHNGNSRSGIIVACYFMYNKNITAKEAVDLAKHYRQKFFLNQMKLNMLINLSSI